MSAPRSSLPGSTYPTVDVGALILNVAALMGKTVRTDVAQPIVLRVDAQALRQILYNLLANAVKYSPTDSQIEVSAAIDAKHLTIEITNPTRPAEALPDLSGAGVGLALSARLCSRLGGALNWPGDDTGQFKATVSLPLPQSDGRSA